MMEGTIFKSKKAGVKSSIVCNTNLKLDLQSLISEMLRIWAEEY